MRMTSWLGGILLVALLALPLMGLAADPPAKKPALKGEYAVMVKVVNLTADQQAQIAEKVQALAVTLKDWDTKNKEKVDKANADVKAAKEAKDKAALKTATDNQKAVLAERAALDAAGKKDIMAVLTAEQQATWASHVFSSGVLRRYAKANLTDEQVAKVKALCDAALKERNALAADDTKGQKAVDANLAKNISEQVLTAEQREALKPAPKAEKPKEGAAK